MSISINNLFISYFFFVKKKKILKFKDAKEKTGVEFKKDGCGRFVRSVCQNNCHVGQKTVKKEKDDCQEEHPKPIF